MFVSLFLSFFIKVDEDEEKKEDVQEKTEAMPRKAGNPITNKK